MSGLTSISFVNEFKLKDTDRERFFENVTCADAISIANNSDIPFEEMDPITGKLIRSDI